MSDQNEVRITNEATGGAKGQKLDRFDLIPAEPLRKVAHHYGVGAQKYDDNNWRKGYDWSLSIGALGRHFNAFCRGEDIDEETGSPHLAGVVFHALGLMEFGETHPELDDRVTPEPEVKVVPQDGVEYGRIERAITEARGFVMNSGPSEGRRIVLNAPDVQIIVDALDAAGLRVVEKA